MRLLLALLLAAGSLLANASLEIDAGETATYDPPNSSPWTDLGARAVEGSIRVNSCPATGTPWIWPMGSLGGLRCIDATHVGYNSGCNVDISGYSGGWILFRVQFDPSLYA